MKWNKVNIDPATLVDVVQSSGKDASWLPPSGGVPNMSSWEEVLEQTQVQVERLYLCTGLGTPRDPPVRAVWCGQWKGSLGPPAETAAFASQPWISC